MVAERMQLSWLRIWYSVPRHIGGRFSLTMPPPLNTIINERYQTSRYDNPTSSSVFAFVPSFVGAILTQRDLFEYPGGTGHLSITSREGPSRQRVFPHGFPEESEY